MNTLLQDLRFAARTAARRPGLPLAIVVTLGLGIGATATMFGVVNTLVLRPLPFHDPGRLVTIWETFDLGGQRLPRTSTFREWQAHAGTLEAVATAERWASSRTVYVGDRAVWLRSQVVGPHALPTLGARPSLGRLPSVGSLSTERDVAVVSERFWRASLEADSSIAGRTIRASEGGAEMPVVAVMPRDFFVFPWAGDVDVWIVSRVRSAGEDDRWGLVFGRLHPGVGRERAQAEARAIAAGRDPADPAPDSGWRITVEPYDRFAEAGQSRLIAGLSGAAILVLLIACANIASMLLSRSVAREREMGTRAALGASGGRLARQLLTESVALALVGGLLGALVAVGGVELFRTLAARFPGAEAIGVDWAVLGFSLFAAAGAGILFGLAPTSWRPRGPLARAPGRTATVTRATARRALTPLVAAQVALAFTLLVATGLMIRTTMNLLNVDRGFRPGDLLTFEITLEDSEFVADPVLAGTTRVTERAAETYGVLLDRLRSSPGVDGVAMASRLPPGWILRRSLTVRDGAEVGNEVWTTYAQVNAGFFSTLGVPLRRGRFFGPRDGPGDRPVAIVNAGLARALFSDGDPIGRHVRVDLGLPAGAEPAPDRVIVGVVGDIRQRLRLPPEPAIYVPYRQSPAVLPGSGDVHLHQQLAVRGAALAAADVRDRLGAVSDELGVEWTYYNLRSMRSRIERSLAEERLFTLVVGLFGLVAIVLAMTGLYALISFLVSRRTSEIGVRVALGAPSSTVVGLVVGQGLRLVLWGIAIGASASLALSRLLAARLYGVAPADPATFGVVTALLVALAASASLVPACRAARVDPLEALRAE